MAISIKDLYAKKKIKKELEDQNIPASDAGMEGQEEFEGEEANEESDEFEAENEVESLPAENEQIRTEEDSEVDDDNDLETTEDTDHISDSGTLEQEEQKGLDAIKKRRLLERIKKLKGE